MVTSSPTVQHDAYWPSLSVDQLDLYWQQKENHSLLRGRGRERERCEFGGLVSILPFLPCLSLCDVRTTAEHPLPTCTHTNT